MRHALRTTARRLPALLLLGALACGGRKGEEAAEGGEGTLATTPDSVGVTDTLVRADGGPGSVADSGPSASAALPSRPPSGGAPAQGSVTVTGTVRVAGAAPMLSVTVTTPDQAWRLHGGPTDEIRRVPGAEVTVTGRPGPASAGPRTLEATAYAIVAIRGQKPAVGQVERRDGALVLVTAGGPLRLDGAGDLADHVGARAWVVGSVDGGTLSVQSYGILRPEG